MRHAPIIRASWRVILIAEIHNWITYAMSEEELLLRPPSIRPLLVRLWMGAFDDHLPLLGPLNALGQSQGPIHDLGPLPPQNSNPN